MEIIKNTKSTKELYGLNPNKICELPYVVVLLMKINSLKKKIDKEIENNNDYKLNELFKALKFNEYLLEEIDNDKVLKYKKKYNL